MCKCLDNVADSIQCHNDCRPKWMAIRLCSPVSRDTRSPKLTVSESCILSVVFQTRQEVLILQKELFLAGKPRPFNRNFSRSHSVW